jgi:hypothetical protein
VRTAGLWSLCAALAGCGLTDYEARMAEAQARVARFDEENRQLDAPLSIPTRAEKVKVKENDKEKEVVVQKPLAEVFLRPPKGISRTAMNKDKPIGGLLYRYPEAPKENTNPPSQPAPAPETNQPQQVTDLYLALRTNVKDGKALDSFQLDVLRLFPSYDKRTMPTTTMLIEPPGREPMKFTVTAIKDEREKTYNWVWVHHAGQTAVAIIFRITGPPEVLEPTLKLCLSTLGVNDDALPLLLAYNKRPGAKTASPATTQPK